METQHTMQTKTNKQYVSGYYRNGSEEDATESFASKLAVFSFATGALAVVWHLAPQVLATTAGAALIVWIAKHWNDHRTIWSEDFTEADEENHPKRRYQRPSDKLTIVAEESDGQRYATTYYTNPRTGLETVLKRRKHKASKTEAYV